MADDAQTETWTLDDGKNNSDMLQFLKGLGFEVTADPDDSSVFLVNKYLNEQSR